MTQLRALWVIVILEAVALAWAWNEQRNEIIPETVDDSARSQISDLKDRVRDLEFAIDAVRRG